MSTVAYEWRELATGERICFERKPGENWRINLYEFIHVRPDDESRNSGTLKLSQVIPETWTGLEFDTPDAGRDFVLRQVVQGLIPRNRPPISRV